MMFEDTADLLDKTSTMQRELRRGPFIQPPKSPRPTKEIRMPKPGDPQGPATLLGPHPLFREYDRVLQDGRILLIPRE